MATYGRRTRRGLPRQGGSEAVPEPGDRPATSESRFVEPEVKTDVTPVRVRSGLPRVTTVEPMSTTASLTDPSESLVRPPSNEHVPPAAEDLPLGVAGAAVGRTPRVSLPQTAQAASARVGRVPDPHREPKRIGPFTRPQWVGSAVVVGVGIFVVCALLVFTARWLISTQWGAGFLATYPGQYALPKNAPVGFPAWLGWQHFLSVFLMVLIVRTGLKVRSDKRPSAFWSPKWNTKRKISLSLWFHQSLDVLWLANGAIFVILLFVTDQWVRIVPTSAAVFPNALSAALSYLSLHWPTENGWVNYNSLQQLAYFTTVFIAAPLAAITGVRMSGVWPKNVKLFNRLYPIEWARAVHFPVMIYFVLFTFVHVMLVLATGALRNLNHMYAAQGSIDPTAYSDNWTGFWIFAGSILLIASSWTAARPMVLAPIARLFGVVTAR
jgi:thiosulfate reductase cytochrome b subunit